MHCDWVIFIFNQYGDNSHDYNLKIMLFKRKHFKTTTDENVSVCRWSLNIVVETRIGVFVVFIKLLVSYLKQILPALSMIFTYIGILHVKNDGLTVKADL